MVSSRRGPARRKRLRKPRAPSARVSGAPSTYLPCPAAMTSQPCALSWASLSAGAARPVAIKTRCPCCVSDGGMGKSRLALAIATAGGAAQPVQGGGEIGARQRRLLRRAGKEAEDARGHGRL